MSRVWNKYGGGLVAPSRGGLQLVRATDAVAEVDVRGGRPTAPNADATRDYHVGISLLHWWLFGQRSTWRGKPYNWCCATTLLRPGTNVVCDLRITMGKSMAALGHHGIISRLAVAAGEPVQLLSKELWTDDVFRDVGRTYAAWIADPGYVPVRETFKADGQVPIEQSVDVRVLVNQALTAYIAEQGPRLEALPPLV